MAGTFTILLLGEGQLPDSKTALYTVPPATATIIKTISVVNTSVNPVLVNLYINSGTSRKIIPSNLSLAGRYSLETDEEYTLQAGDSIEGDADVANVCDYTINGVSET